MRKDSEVRCVDWDRGVNVPICLHLGRTGRQGVGVGNLSGVGGVGGAGPPVKWPQGDLKCIWGPLEKPGKVLGG